MDSIGGDASLEIPVDGLRLNIGSGSRRPPGYYNVDIQEDPKATRKLDAIGHAKSVPLPDGCACELMAIHFWEHLFRWECDEVMAEWKRLLRPGGKLVLELPNLIKCCQNVIDGRMRGGKHPDQLGMWGLFGDDRFKDPHMIHKYGWSPQTLEAYLKEQGFVKIKHLPTVFHPAGRDHRDMRIEARRA